MIKVSSLCVSKTLPLLGDCSEDGHNGGMQLVFRVVCGCYLLFMACWQTLQSSRHQCQTLLEGGHQICLFGKEKRQKFAKSANFNGYVFIFLVHRGYLYWGTGGLIKLEMEKKCLCDLIPHTWGAKKLNNTEGLNGMCPVENSQPPLSLTLMLYPCRKGKLLPLTLHKICINQAN